MEGGVLKEGTSRPPPDPLFLERLEAFMETNLSTIRAFAQRENYSFEETRRYVAEWHCRYLFRGLDQQLPDGKSVSSSERDLSQPRAQELLQLISQALESLSATALVHSFFLAVNISDSSDESFLGGTTRGREFWRGLRGGGLMGARAFKAFCMKHARRNEGLPQGSASKEDTASTVSASAKKSPANALKAEVYSNVRDALRAVSSVQNAEMKWTNHERLAVYDVQLVGWPDAVPRQNPSTLTTQQNQLLLDALKSGTMKFLKVTDPYDETAQDTISTDNDPDSQQGNSTVVDDQMLQSWIHQESYESSERAAESANAISVSNPPDSRSTLVSGYDTVKQPHCSSSVVVSVSEQAGGSSTEPGPSFHHALNLDWHKTLDTQGHCHTDLVKDNKKRKRDEIECRQDP